MLPWFGFSPYSELILSTASIPEVTWPNGAKRCASRKLLSLKLTKICVDRESGADVCANVT